MADPISLLASLLAVATAGIEVSKTLYKLADTIGNSNDEIRAIGEQVSAFSQALGDLHEFLEGASDLISKRASQNARHIVRICREIFAKIGRNLQFSKRKYGNQFWQSVQWMFRRDKVKPLCASLESYKTTLSVMLLTMKLAKCKKSMMKNGSQAPTEKENRYRANLELDILSNSAAITRWHRAEFEAQAMSHGNNGPEYVDREECISTVPAEELQWLSALVPYKPPSSEMRLSKEQPTGSQEASNGLNELEQPQITSTINMLLAKWTTLYEPATSRRPAPPVQTLRNLGSAPTARSIKRKARNGTKQPVRASKTASKGQKELIKIEKVLQKDGNSRHLRSNPSSQNLKVQVESPADWITISETERNGDWNGSIARKEKEDRQHKVHKSASPFDATGEDNSRSYGAPPPVSPNPTQFPMSFTPYPPFRVPYPPTSMGIPSHGPPSQDPDIMTDPLAGWSFQPFGGPSLPAPSMQHPTVTCHPAIPILEPVTSAASSPIPSQPMPEVRHDEVRGPSLTSYQNYDIHELVSLAKDFIKTAGDEESEGESKNVTRKSSDDSHHSTENLNGVSMATAATPIKVQQERLKSSQREQPAKMAEYVTLKDFDERVFKLPYRMCNTWTAMQARIQDILNGTTNDEKVKTHVQNGYFDICDENDEIILPTTWDWIMEDRRQNGITLNMKLRPFQGESGEETSVEGKGAEGTGGLLYTMANLLTSDDSPPESGPQEGPFKPSTKSPGVEPDSQSVDTESSDDPAEDFVGDDLDWRYNFLYKLDEHDERFQKIWEVEMRRSQVKAEHTMLSFLLGESKAKLDELDFTYGKQATQSATEGTAQPSNEKADPSRDQPSTSRGSTDSVPSAEDIKDGVPGFTDQASNSTASPPPQISHQVPPPIILEPGPPETGAIDSEHQPSHESQGQRDDLSSNLLSSRHEALEDANQRANDAAAKAHALEQKLKEIEDTVARRVLQTPPKTPPAQESSFTLSVGAGSSSGQASVKNAESVTSKSRASFRKRIFGRNRTSGTVS